jgi:hypothetical protein
MEDTSKSEVAWRLKLIKQQYEAAQKGLSGLAQGSARHTFISARMQSMGRIHKELQNLVGPEQAIRLVAETLQEHTCNGNDQEASLPTTDEKGQ